MKRMLLALLCTATLGGNAQTLLPAPQHLEYTSKKQFELHQGLQPQTMAGAPAPTLLLQEAFLQHQQRLPVLRKVREI